MIFSKIKKTILIILFLYVCNFAQKSTDNELETIYTEEVKVSIAAYDAQGRTVENLEKEDLVVLDGNRLHQPTSIRKIPANILIVMDTGGQLRRAKSLNQTQKTVEKFISFLQEEDSVSVMQYNDKIEFLTEWETNKENLIEILKRRSNFGKRSVFLQALLSASNFLKKFHLENQHLLLITDGTDTSNSQAKINETMKAFLSSNVTVHIISYTKLETIKFENSGLRSRKLGVINLDKEMSDFYDKRFKAILESEKNLSELAKDTNGEFILPTSLDEMVEKTKLVAAKIASTYIITYEPKIQIRHSSKQISREIKVFSRRPGVYVSGDRKLIVAQSSEKP